MNARRYARSASRGPVSPSRRSNWWLLAIVLVAGVELAGALAVPALHGGAGPASPSAVAPSKAVIASTPSAVPTHGDLVVTSGQTVYIPQKTPPRVPGSYYQGGNITVEKGGTLIVQNTTLSFVQFIADFGTPESRLADLFHFDVQTGGTVIFRNSTLTTDTFVENPYVKLNVNDSGSLTFWDSKVLAPGFLTVGSGGDLTVNESSVSPNPGVHNLTTTNTSRADVAFAPTLSVEAGGVANFFSSVYRGLYADNLTKNGTPGPLPLNSTVPLSVANGTNFTDFTTPTTSAALGEDAAYPSIAGGSLTIFFNTTKRGGATTDVTVWYGGTAYALNPTTIPANSTSEISVPFTSGLTKAINAGGIVTWLNRTGDFSGLPSGISVAFHLTSGLPIPNATLSFTLNAPLAFGMTASGAGATVNTVNSFLGLDFSNLSAPDWVTHQLNLTDGAAAYLANLTIAGKLQNNTSAFGNGAIVADPTSHAYLYRWASILLNGKGGILPAPGGEITATYEYPSSELDNATAQQVNNLKANVTAIWDYLQYWDSLRGASAYGASDTNGVASILLASNNISGPTDPDGNYLGDYHLTVTPPTGAGAPLAFNISVRPYPMGVANGSAGYGVADSFGNVTFPLYFAAVTIPANGVVVTADGKATTTIRIGELLNVSVTLTDAGSAPITTLAGTLYYNNSSKTNLTTVTRSVDLTAPGQTAVVSMDWKVNETIVGDYGKARDTNLSISIVWNKDLVSLGGGGLHTLQEVAFTPSSVVVSGVVTVPVLKSSLGVDEKYFTDGVVAFNGSGSAYVQVVAYARGSFTPITLGTDLVSIAKGSTNATFSISWSSSQLTRGTTYLLAVNASYNSVGSNVTLIPSASVPSPSPSNFLTKTVLGLPVWAWIVVVVVVIVAILGFLMITRRQAAGKLVECGECGNLVPEGSKVCPKCGAEFESDVVRCSRCSSTIPADSKFCPECAAQLLGKPGEGGVDPERQAYADFTERYRAEAKKELGENYTESAFWDWWKRQPTYTPFSQWKLQQGQGTPRAGMSPPPPGGPPPGAAGAAPTSPGPRGAGPPPPRPPASSASAGRAPPAPTPVTTAPGALKPCPSCSKEIPPEYLVCPFCGSVTQ